MTFSNWKAPKGGVNPVLPNSGYVRLIFGRITGCLEWQCPIRCCKYHGILPIPPWLHPPRPLFRLPPHPFECNLNSSYLLHGHGQVWRRTHRKEILTELFTEQRRRGMESWIRLLQICRQLIAPFIIQHSFLRLIILFFPGPPNYFPPPPCHLLLCIDNLWICSCVQKNTSPLLKYISSFWYHSLRLNSGNKTPISLLDDSSESMCVQHIGQRCALFRVSELTRSMCGVSCVCESIGSPDGVWGCCLCYVGLGGPHESPPVLNCIGVCQNHTIDGSNTHKINQPLKIEPPCTKPHVFKKRREQPLPLCSI